MSATDVYMSLEEFGRYYRQNRSLISSAKAYDAAARLWVEGESIFEHRGAYTLIVVRHRNGHFLRVAVRSTIQVTYAPEWYRNAGFWRDLGICLTYEEKAFLERAGGSPLALEELVQMIEGSDFPGKGTLAGKLKKALQPGK